MKANKPSLVLYIIVFVLVLVFKLIGYETLELYGKAVIIPILFMYYLITNNYKISFIKGAIFFFCFTGEVIVLLHYFDSVIGGLFSFLMVYLLLFKLAVDDFRKMKLVKEDFFSMLITIVFVTAISFTVLSLKLESIKLDFYLFVIYAVALSFLTFFSITNYLKKLDFCNLNLVLMSVSFMVSDIFFVINAFYLKIFAISFIYVVTQLLAFYFMVIYFIEKDKIT